MPKIVRIFFWYFPIAILLSLIGTFTIYHSIPGQTSLMFLSLFVVAFACPSQIYSKSNYPYALVFLISGFLFISVVILFNGTADIQTRFMMVPFGFCLGFTYIYLKDEYKHLIFSRFLTVYSILLVLSMIEFIIIIYFNRGFLIGVVGKSTTEYSFFNHYIFNIIRIGGVRFQSLCDEPGDIGTLNGLLLFAIGNIKTYRKQFTIFLMAGLLSLSFAFYVFLFLYILWQLSKIKVNFLLSALIAGSLFYFSMSEQVNKYIIDRYMEEEYDNRTGDGLAEKFSSFVRSSDIWVGNGFNAELKLSGGSSGVKKDLYETGIIGVLLLFITFSFPYLKIGKANIHKLVFFLIFWLSYYQRSNLYSPEILCTFFSVTFLSNTKK